MAPSDNDSQEDRSSVLRGICRGLFLLPSPKSSRGGPPAPAPPPPPAIGVEISDEEIEARALEAVAQFGNLPPDQLEARWKAWEQEVEQDLPPYPAEEVIRR